MKRTGVNDSRERGKERALKKRGPGRKMMRRGWGR